MPSINNDQNIIRVYPKMTEGFHAQQNANLCDCVKSVAYFDHISDLEEDIDTDEELQINGHMYSPNKTESDNEINECESSVINCQTTESEVKLIKEWLMIQTDLIQQQNDDILDKDREIFILRKENEMLRERINEIEKEIRFETDSNKVSEESGQREDCLEEMTQGSNDDNDKNNIEVIQESYCVSESSTKLFDFEGNSDKASDEESQIDSGIVDSVDNSSGELVLTSEQLYISDISDSFKTESEFSNCDRLFSDCKFEISSICDSALDSTKGLRMSITRKRVCSNSSAVSPNESATVEEKEPHRRFKKRKRRLTKDTQIINSKEHYVTQAHEVNLGIAAGDLDITDTTLEVPRWRHKIYPSCYTMEGTENLDDEVYTKRHIRLEIDERRRKRWDVQRIREQRVIEKLKQRQEKAALGHKGEGIEPLPSLWPKVEDLKYLEINDELPVSAFGSPVPKIPSSEFVLPWLSNPSIVITKKSVGRKSIVKRKSLRR